MDATPDRLTEHPHTTRVWKVTVLVAGFLVSLAVLCLALTATQAWTTLFTARMQMAFTLGFHIILACLGVGLPVLMLFAEGRFLRTNDDGWRILARRWSRAFAVMFAVGAASGTVLSFELGLFWPNLMGRFGAVFGIPFTLEGFAFFLEAIFAGIYLYGWDRLPARVHWWSGVPIALSGFASAAFVVTANSWMNTPQGFELVEGRVVNADPLAAMLNPATGAQVTHMLVAAYLVTGFVIAAFYAMARLRGHDTLYQRRAMAVGVAMGVVCTPLQIVVGDWTAKVVARTQPIKLVAMVTGLFSLGALFRRRFTLAVLGALCTVAAVIWGWGLAQYPLLIPPAVTLEAAKSPESVLWFVVYSVAGGSVFLGPALAYLLYVFKGQRPAQA